MYVLAGFLYLRFFLLYGALIFHRRRSACILSDLPWCSAQEKVEREWNRKNIMYNGNFSRMLTFVDAVFSSSMIMRTGTLKSATLKISNLWVRIEIQNKDGQKQRMLFFMVSVSNQDYEKHPAFFSKLRNEKDKENLFSKRERQRKSPNRIACRALGSYLVVSFTSIACSIHAPGHKAFSGPGN